VGLCASANPNALEILFADERDWIFETPAWRRLHEERRRFLTKKVQQTFLGYAMAQLKKIKTHRSWLLTPPTKKPAREHFGLPAAGGTLSRDDQNRIEQSIADKIRSYGIDNIDMPKSTRIAVQDRLDAFCRDVLSASDGDIEERMRAVATHALNLPADVVAALNAEKGYRAAMKHWDSTRHGRASVTLRAPSWSASTVTIPSTPCTSFGSCAWVSRSSSAVSFSCAATTPPSSSPSATERCRSMSFWRPLRGSSKTCSAPQPGPRCPRTWITSRRIGWP